MIKEQAPVMLTAVETAKRYGIVRRTLMRWIEDPLAGFPQPITIGKQMYFRRAALEAWEERKQPAGERRHDY